MTTVNYTNRTVDVALFGLSEDGASINMGLRPTALAITGKLKASQNYIRLMFSTIGERKEDPTLGSDMVHEFKTTNISLPIQIEQTFAIYNVSVLKWMKDWYAELSVPEDEQVKSTKLLSYSIQPGGKISLYIQLSTQAGESVAFYLPVAWSIT